METCQPHHILRVRQEGGPKERVRGTHWKPGLAVRHPYGGEEGLDGLVGPHFDGE